MSELPERTNACPLIVGDRIFTPAEPGELLCLDGVAASPTLIGKHLAVMENQGWCLVFEPGPVFKQVALNRIETMLPRDWPLPPQETIANGPPVVDGDRIYLRGERYLYCIGAQ